MPQRPQPAPKRNNHRNNPHQKRRQWDARRRQWIWK